MWEERPNLTIWTPIVQREHNSKSERIMRVRKYIVCVSSWSFFKDLIDKILPCDKDLSVSYLFNIYQIFETQWSSYLDLFSSKRPKLVSRFFLETSFGRLQ